MRLCLVLSVLINILPYSILTDQKILNDYIRHYEDLHYDVTELINQHLRAKRSTDKSIELKFSALGRKFHLDLYPSDSVFAHDHKFRQSDGKESHVDTSFIYDGKIRGVPGGSVHGAVLDGLFQGVMVVSQDKIYFIEPASRYFRGHDPPTHAHSVIYREEDLNLDPYRHKRDNVGHHGSCGFDKYKEWMTASAQPASNDGIDVHDDVTMDNIYSRDSNTEFNRHKRAPGSCYSKPKRTCNLYLRADPVLFNETRDRLGSVAAANNEIMALFSTHVFAINQIYNNTKFETFFPATTLQTPCFEGINFRILRTTIMTDESLNCNTYLRTSALSFCNPNIDVSNFLNLNSLENHDEFCLAFVFTYRDFSGGTLGLAWVGSPSGAAGRVCERYKPCLYILCSNCGAAGGVCERSRGQGAAGGVCERYKTIREQGRTVQKSLNTGIVTLINYARRVPPRVSHLTFAHEVGHNFGSPHDSGSICAPGGDAGNYIMYPSATKGNLRNNELFSECSRDNITRVLNSVVNQINGKVNCFTASDAAFCGNGIKEKGEECDCGYRDDCTDQCCHPRDNLNPNDDKLRCTLKVNGTGHKVQCR
ncbi:disintegrin and metalloproteinase domain-containing protein 10 homolog [Magallana gigas]|uniref:disintegrin and metalloproteinase domain-containing protein 10 homolog n=1 Tax=Magallana gigas TaxID=29159 RepID=UPI003341A5A1